MLSCPQCAGGPLYLAGRALRLAAPGAARRSGPLSVGNNRPANGPQRPQLFSFPHFYRLSLATFLPLSHKEQRLTAGCGVFAQQRGLAERSLEDVFFFLLLILGRGCCGVSLVLTCGSGLGRVSLPTRIIQVVSVVGRMGKCADAVIHALFYRSVR